MKRTYYYIICAICAICGFSSCGDFLEIKSQNEIVLEDFWKEKADVDGIVAGCYSALQADGVIRRMIIWGEGRSDNVAIGQNIDQDINLENILKESITAMNDYTTYDAFYNVINRCNTVMLYAPDVAAKDPGYTQSELAATIAEVTGLRALCYFYLIRTFRDVPYTTVAYTDDDQEMQIPATPFYAVLDSLISDLERVKDSAVKRYPETQPLYQTGRITQDAIYAMLCEMYLWKKDYQNCVRYADLVIQSKKDQVEENRSKISSGRNRMGNSQSENESRFNGFPLISESSLSNYFGNAYEEIFGQGNSQETIFELIYDDSPQANGMLANSAVGVLYGNSDVNQGFMAPSSAVLDDVSNATYAVYAEKTKKYDARIYENCNADNKSISKFVYSSIDINGASSNSILPASYSGKRASNNIGSNWIIYRLTDIMLLKAEALAQTMIEGSDSLVDATNEPIKEQVFNLVNAINKRAVCEATTSLKDTLMLSDYKTKSQMVELVMLERQRELMFEGKRWYDLVRRSMRDGNTQTLSQAVMKRESVNGQFVQNFFKKMDAIFWPYNNEETKVNKALVQNPAFGSGENDSYAKAK